MSIEIIIYRLPAYWACALINGDYNGRALLQQVYP